MFGVSIVGGARLPDDQHQEVRCGFCVICVVDHVPARRHDEHSELVSVFRAGEAPQADMCEAVLVDLIHACCTGPLLREEPVTDAHVFLLCGERHRDRPGSSDPVLSSSRSVQVLNSGSTAESLYRFKQTVDELDLSSVRVLTTPQGRDVLGRFQELLFTAVYTFTYKVTALRCPSCGGPAHMDSPGEGVHEEVSAFLQQLPALKGPVTVLTSSLIPGQTLGINFLFICLRL